MPAARQEMRMAHVVSVRRDLVLVEQRHHRADERPKNELKAQDQADPFVDASAEQRRQADFLHAVFLLRRLKDQISSHAPLIAMANALQAAMRRSALLTSVRQIGSANGRTQV